MPIYTLSDQQLEAVPRTSFQAARVLERQDLQAALQKNIGVIAPSCMVLAEEFGQWDGSQRRIDLLALDKNANLVVIELKRNDTGEHMELQSIRYAAMVSTMTFRQAVECYRRHLHLKRSDCDPEQEILDFLGWVQPREEDFALEVKIVLVSADFSQELTTSVMWLNQSGLDIRCVRLIPYSLGDQLLVDVQQIIPLPEAESYQVKIRQQTDERREARNSDKDYTQYEFLGVRYNKRKLVLAVIKHWVDQHHPVSIDDLRAAFPSTVRSNLFREFELAQQQYQSTQIDRYFLGDEDLPTFQGQQWAICNQWGRGNIPAFIDHVSKSLGYEVLPVS